MKNYVEQKGRIVGEVMAQDSSVERARGGGHVERAASRTFQYAGPVSQGADYF